MSMPIVDKAAVITNLRRIANRLNLPVQVQDTYPSNDDNVAYGVYVNEIFFYTRQPYQLGVQKCGSIYTATDRLNILYVSYQNDPQAATVLTAINELAADSSFWDGYHEVDFIVDRTFGARNEIYTYLFDLKRMDFNV